MTLVEPARRMWLAHRESIRRCIERAAQEARLLLGGGTILASRWDHRRSTDLDIVVPELGSIAKLQPGGSADLCRATGGRLLGRNRNRIKIALGAGLLDVTAQRARLQGAERTEDVEGIPEQVLTNAQILVGKLYRTDRTVTRDAYDLIIANTRDPRALEIAVNTLSAEDALSVRRNLYGRNDRMAGTAQAVLQELNASKDVDTRNLGRNVSFAIAAHRYTSVTITAQQHGIVIETESKEQKRREEYACAEAQHALTETGIAAYVEANHPMAEDELRDAVSRGAEDSLARTTSFSFGMSTLSVSHRPQAKP